MPIGLGSPTKLLDAPPAALDSHAAIADGRPWLTRRTPEATIALLAGQSVLHRVPSGSTLFEQAETPAFALFAGREAVSILDRSRRTRDVGRIRCGRPICCCRRPSLSSSLT